MNAQPSSFPSPGSEGGAVNQPHNIEAEQALLGALLLNNEVSDMIVGLDPEHFYDPVHGRIYALTMSSIAQGRHVSPVTLKSVVQSEADLADALRPNGGAGYLMRLVESTVSVISASEYARIIRELAGRRDMIALAEELTVRAASEHSVSVDEMLDAADHAITEFRVRAGEAKLVIPFEQALESAAGWADAAFHRDGSPEISTGLRRLDEILGGLQRGRIYLLIGTSSMGKSALGIDMAGALVRQGRGVLFASFEMPAEEVAHRRVSAYMARNGLILPHFDVACGRMSETQYRDYLQASLAMRREPFLVAEDNTLEIGRLRAAIVRAQKRLERTETPLGAVFVDYLQLIRVPGAKDRVTEVGHGIRELKQWAKEFDLPIVVLAQAKPEVEERKNKRPSKRDIQWASEAHQAADAVIAVYRHDYYLNQAIAEAEGREKSELIAEMHDCAGAVELIISKQRGGPTGTVIAYADLATNRFSDSRLDNDPTAVDANHTNFGI